MIKWLPILAFVAVFFSGCQKENCEKLLQVACSHVEEREDGEAICKSLTEKADTVEDAQCAEILQLLQDSGKLQNLR